MLVPINTIVHKTEETRSWIKIEATKVLVRTLFLAKVPYFLFQNTKLLSP
jgi:hypothetical protein